MGACQSKNYNKQKEIKKTQLYTMRESKSEVSSNVGLEKSNQHKITKSQSQAEAKSSTKTIGKYVNLSYCEVVIICFVPLTLETNESFQYSSQYVE